MKTENFTLEEAVSVCAFWTCASDGNIDDSEINFITENPFFSSFKPGDHVDLFKDLLTSEDPSLIKIMNSEFPKSFEECDDDWKKEFIINQLALVRADGEVDEDEITTVIFVASLMGLDGQAVVDISNEELEKAKAQHQTSSSNSSSSEGCFVATATMGDYNHPVVIDLRKYRDEVLQQTVFGRLFIKFYYKFGPIPAKIIARNKSLRDLSLKYLIKPLHTLIKSF